MLLGFVVLVTGITLYQERKTERALEALRDLASPRALVVRDGDRRRIPGARSCAATSSSSPRAIASRPTPRSLTCSSLAADESLLTGESVPVRKSRWDGRGADRAAGGRRPAVRLRGHAGHARAGRRGGASRPGPRTEMGTIGKALAAARARAHARCSARPAASCAGSRWSAALLCVAVVVGYGLARADWLGGVLAGLTLAMAILPNEFPAVLDHLPRARRLAHLAPARAHAPRARARDARGRRPCCASTRPARSTQNQMTRARSRLRERALHDVTDGERSPRRSTSSSSTRSSRASAIRSIRWRRRSRTSASAGSRAPSTSTRAGRWCASTRSPRRCSRSRTSGARPRATSTSSPPRAPPRRSPISATCRAGDGRGAAGGGRARWRPRACACSAWRARASGPARSRQRQHDFDFELRRSRRRSPIRCARRSRPPSPSARAAGVRVVMITGDHPRTARAIARPIGLRAPTTSSPGRSSTR